jgi:hypothetical protein
MPMLRIIAPHVTFGYPSLNSIRKLMYKRGFAKVTENYTRNEWRRFEKYTRNEWRRFEKYTRNEWRRFENYFRNEWRIVEATLETS